LSAAAEVYTSVLVSMGSELSVNTTVTWSVALEIVSVTGKVQGLRTSTVHGADAIQPRKVLSEIQLSADDKLEGLTYTIPA